MITLKQAKELAKQAHEGQFRKSRNMTTEEYYKYGLELKEFNYYDEHTLHDGSKVSFNGINHGWIIYEPYITHPLAVMNMMDTEEEKIVAVLHDVLEDCKGYGIGRTMDNSTFWIKTPNNKVFISFKIYCALSLITYEKTTSYLNHITHMTQGIVRYDIRNKNAGRLATKVKIADIVCNLADNPSEHAKQKYLKALPILLKGI